MNNDLYYAERVAKQAIIVAILRKKMKHEEEVLDEILKGTPPNLFPEPR